MGRAAQTTFFRQETIDKRNYAGTEFFDTIFEECIFTNCDFSECRFSRSRFVDCFFTDCNWSMAKLGDCGVQNASFRECKLLGVDFSETGAFLFSVKFESCVLDFASFAGKKMPDTPFLQSSLKQTVFIQADLAGSRFDGCDLDGAIFDETVLTGADFTAARHYAIDPERNMLRKAKFSVHGLPGLLLRYGIRVE